jgi:hypothetical protein
MPASRTFRISARALPAPSSCLLHHTAVVEYLPISAIQGAAWCQPNKVPNRSERIALVGRHLTTLNNSGPQLQAQGRSLLCVMILLPYLSPRTLHINHNEAKNIAIIIIDAK